jgi:hypothetical protein
MFVGVHEISLLFWWYKRYCVYVQRRENRHGYERGTRRTHQNFSILLVGTEQRANNY